LLNTKKILQILKDNNIYLLCFILFLTLLNTVLEIVGIGLIIPILGIFVGQDYERYLSFLPFLKENYNTKALIYVFVIFNLVYLLKFITSIFSILMRNKYYWNLYRNLSNKIFQNFINKDYLSHMTTHSAEKINTIKGEANLFSFGVTSPFVDLIADIILLVSISIFLLVYDFKLSFFVIIFFLLISFLWNRYYNKYLLNLGKMREKHAKETIKEIQNSFGNFRETIMLGLRKLFFNRFQGHNKAFALIGVKRDTIIQLPRFLLELLSVTGIFLILFTLIKNNLPLSEILVLLGVIVFATLRMLPSVTKIIRSIQTLKFNSVVVDKIHAELSDYNSLNKKSEQKFDKFEFKKISLNDFNFKYPKTDKLILKKVNLEINKNEKIGIIGGTGSGKSTLINIISGLIDEKNGLKVDGNFLDEKKIISWQSNVGYVPHDVFLLDETIGYNISFQQDYKNKEKNILELLHKVELLEFVENQPKKLETVVGEKSSKLSRGQTQRLGIARALYSKPQILIFDEATSALDVNTERKILKKLYDKSHDLTIISISHRKSALEFCDKVFEINDGQLEEIVNNLPFKSV